MKSAFLRAFVLGSLLGLAVLPHAAHAQVTRSFGYTGGYQLFVVPEGVFTLTVKLWGAGGSGAGGSGAFVTGNLAVTPGANLTLLVGGGGIHRGSGSFGGGGAGGIDGSGGGGRSAIRLSANNSIVSDELVTAAGGGGGGRFVGSGVGGGGGLSAGQSGTGSAPGRGGTQTSGGAGGNYFGFVGQPGSQFKGGDAGDTGTGPAGGGGGGGYFGGGGGARNGGGGGSSYYVNPAFAFNSALSQAGSQGNASGSVLPGGANDPSYLTGIGIGTLDPFSGGNGLIVFSYIAVPEPGSLALLALGAGAFLIARRRRTT